MWKTKRTRYPHRVHACIDTTAQLRLEGYSRKLGKPQTWIMRQALDHWFRWIERRGGNLDTVPRVQRRAIAAKRATAPRSSSSAPPRVERR
jgi:hypothetical protein